MEIPASDIETTGIVLVANNLRRSAGEVGALARFLAKKWHGIVKAARHIEEMRQTRIEVVGKFSKT